MKNTDFYITFKDGSKVEQIEKAALILYNVFGTLQSNSVSPESDEKFQSEVFSMCQIGTAFVDSIWANISDFIEPDETEEIAAPNLNTDDLLNLSQFTENIDADSENGFDEMAVSLSQILNNPAMPITLYNALQTAIAEVYSGGDNDTLNRFESSPEFIRAVFKASQNHES